jgi:hypothetical protein
VHDRGKVLVRKALGEGSTTNGRYLDDQRHSRTNPTLQSSRLRDSHKVRKRLFITSLRKGAIVEGPDDERHVKTIPHLADRV